MEEKDTLAQETIYIQPPSTPETPTAVERAFDINPESVYGVLCGLLLMAIIWLAWSNRRKDAQLLKIATSTVEVLKDLNTSLLLLKEELKDGTVALKEQITFTREHIAEKISQIKT